MWFAALAAIAAAMAAAIDSRNEYGHDLAGWTGLFLYCLLCAAATFFSSIAVLVAVSRAIDPMLSTANLLPDRATTPPQPPSMSQFSGRRSEMARLLDQHTRYRKLREGDTKALGPVVIAIHGEPGVGKSALAQELARRLRSQYPDGLVSAIFGASGAPRGAADITRDLLLRLGWRDDEVPRDADDRVATLRSLSRDKRILFLFDAVRDHDQVNQVMPAGAGCGVILTSRREIGASLGLPPVPPLDRMSLADGLEMLSSIGHWDWLRDAPTAVEIVELCERLPLAILAAAERMAAGADPRQVAELLRDPRHRINVLEYNTRSLRERIGSEFNRLLPDQHDALVVLSTLDSETFVPWVLRPLLRLEHGASNMAAALAATQLVEYVGLDELGQPRYRVPALVRAYARQQPARRLDIEAARVRLDEAYRAIMDEVLAKIDPTYRPVQDFPGPWSTAAATIAGNVDMIVRREYLNLVRVISRTPMAGYQGMIWRVAARLDGRVPSLRDHAVLADDGAPAQTDEGQADGRDDHTLHRFIGLAFERALQAVEELGRDEPTGSDRAARDDEARIGEIDVLLARAQFFVAVERQGDAQADLRRVVAQTERLQASPEHERLARQRRLRAARIRATSFIQFGAYAQGNLVMAEAERLTGRMSADERRDPYVRTDVGLLRLLNAAAERVGDGAQWTSPDPHASGPEAVEFGQRLEDAEELRRQSFFGAAAQVLRGQLNRDGDTRGRALLQYRLSRLDLDEAGARSRPAEGEAAVDPDETVRESGADAGTRASAQAYRQHARAAVESAAAAVVAYGDIRDVIGQIRARCQLVKALVEAGESIVATQVSVEIDDELRALPGGDVYLRRPLEGRHLRVRAEVQIARGSFQSAWKSLTKAARTFRELHDWRNYASVLRRLENLDRRPERDDLGDPF